MEWLSLPDDLVFRSSYHACRNELAGGVKYNQEERAGDGHAFSLLHDYLKLAEGAHADEITKLTKA